MAILTPPCPQCHAAIPFKNMYGWLNRPFQCRHCGQWMKIPYKSRTIAFTGFIAWQIFKRHAVGAAGKGLLLLAILLVAAALLRVSVAPVALPAPPRRAG